MSALLVLLLAVQQWTVPVRVSPDTLPGTHPAVCWGEGWGPHFGETYVCWFSSDRLWSRVCISDSWSEPILVDTTHCTEPAVRTSSMCKGRDAFVWVVWPDVNNFVRLSHYNPLVPHSWSTSSRDSMIKGRNPGITSDTSGNIWSAWTMLDTSGTEYCYLASYYDGNEWSDPVFLKRILPVEITYTAGITADHEGNIWVCYNDQQYVWVQYWNGSIWSPPESIGACFDHAYPTMCADSPTVWVSWFNSTANMGQGGIFARYHNGTAWSDSIEFPHKYPALGWHNPHTSICLDPQGKLWAGWWETQAIWSPNYSILASCYEHNMWEGIATVDSVVDAWGGWASVAHGDNKVWMVWQSEKEGDWNVYAAYAEIRERPFIRADANSDSTVTMGDALYTLRHLYIPGSPSPSCMKTADSDDSGDIAMSDAIYTLKYLHVPGAPEPPPPFPDCGVDPTADGLSCDEHPCMGGRQAVRRKVGSVR